MSGYSVMQGGEAATSTTAYANDGWVDRLRASLARHTGLALLVTAVVAGAYLVSLSTGQPFNPSMVDSAAYLASLMLPPLLLIVMAWRFLQMAVVHRPSDPLKFYLRDLRGLLFRFDGILDGLVLLALFSLFLSSFAYLKDNIPNIQPFWWDPIFAHLDRMLFLGHDPWRVLQPLFGSPLATMLLNVAYNGWFFLMYFFIIALAFVGRNQELRFSFAYGFILTWTIGGVVLAVLLSSAGPVYFERLGFGSDFAPLMALLKADNQVYPVWSLSVQQALWQSYVGGHGAISGISAMPSMHIANAVFFAAIGYRLGRAAGIALTVFAVIIFIGSIQLGWHYAVDGIVGAAIALVCWRLGCYLARRDLQRHDRLGFAFAPGGATISG